MNNLKFCKYSKKIRLIDFLEITYNNTENFTYFRNDDLLKLHYEDFTSHFRYCTFNKLNNKLDNDPYICVENHCIHDSPSEYIN